MYQVSNVVEVMENLGWVGMISLGVSMPAHQQNKQITTSSEKYAARKFSNFFQHGTLF